MKANAIMESEFPILMNLYRKVASRGTSQFVTPNVTNMLLIDFKFD